MKSNKKQNILLVSLLLNLLLVFVICIQETKGHVFALALERRNLITLPDSSHPDYWARVGWQNTIDKLHIQFDVAFFGNSITRGSDFQSFFQDKKIINIGYSGDNIEGMIRRVSMLKASHPSKIFIMAGTNDLFKVSVDDFAERYNILLDNITDSIPSAKVYLESILPMNRELKSDVPSDEKIRQANTKISKIAKDRGLVYIDVYSLYEKDGVLPSSVTKDGIHLYTKKYKKWAELIENYIYE